MDRGQSGINIEAWTQDAVSAALPRIATVSAALAASPSPRTRGASVSLDIPLDAEAVKSQTAQRREAKQLKARIVAAGEAGSGDDGPARTGYVRRQSGGEIRRRDSLKRREALLKGKEGSRRRQKWENDRLLGNPAFQPPEPEDWAPRPTHPTQHVPYVLAPLWDHHYADATRARAERAQKAALENDPSRQVPRELRERMKKARGAKALLQDLEEQVRAFVQEFEETQREQERLEQEGWDVAVEDTSEDESSEEEVVFVGRKEVDKPARRKTSKQVQADKLVFDSLVEDHGASFGRWLVHSIASYYDLRTWSRTTGDPARREAYVGIPETKLRTGRASSVGMATELPRPLYVLV